MRRSPVLALVVAVPLVLLSGCLAGNGPPGGTAVLHALDDCRSTAPTLHTLHFAAGHRLQTARPAAGAEPGNAFSSGFLTNDLKEWLSGPVADGLWLVGNVTLDYWVRSTGSPAPLAVGGDTGEGYHFFNQFGSDRTLQPAYATEYSTVAPAPGAVDHYTETLAMPPGGFVVEAGDRVRVLLTDLALDGPAGSGHEVLFGGDTPSQVRFHARCFPDLAWPHSTLLLDEAVELPGNQGLLTGRVPPTEGFNLARFDVTVPTGTQRLSVRLTQVDDANPVKDDIDLVLVQPDGAGSWGIGSPYSDERGTLWYDNLVHVFPTGLIQVQVDSYSGAGYSGRLVVTAERAALS